ncbi:monooxygenase [Vibrio tapetis]|uniref:Monooxygenase n=1 Tax=Vibrio tapetis subsp. tapetis TaxID=1671868 RepID=A0A2N8ZJA8_9VIBR|nr:monooxygenase [Vibrio tapetis]SON51989.1 hypothetical protein VTAP4600_B0378 [Vibrio tapetis subsp. tapetis]
MKLLQVDFGFNGPFGKAMSEGLVELANSINHEPGMKWKIWTENETGQIAGGVYLFDDEKSTQDYLAMHSARLKKMGIAEIRGVIFDVNQPLTQINSGPVFE